MTAYVKLLGTIAERRAWYSHGQEVRLRLARSPSRMTDEWADYPFTIPAKRCWKLYRRHQWRPTQLPQSRFGKTYPLC